MKSLLTMASNSIEQGFTPKLRISASVVAANWINLGVIIKSLEKNGVEMLHFDIEDGHFTPYLSMGIKIISELRQYSDLAFDVHLEVSNPEIYIDSLARMGVNRISIPWESCHCPLQLLTKIKSNKIKAGLVFNPTTPIPDLTYLLPNLDFVNLLSTDPLENNGEFIASTISKLESGYNTYSKEKLEWVVDGGVTNENISSIISSHANIVVIGRYLFEGCIDEKISQMNRVVEKIQFSRV